MQNKRGQELSTTAIILIILGVLVLVILIVGFALGWNRIAPWLSRDNVNQVVDSCNSACTTKSVYDFCLKGRDMTAEKVDYKALTCNYIANYMQRDTTKNFGVQKCIDLDCTTVEVLNKNMNVTDFITVGNPCSTHLNTYIQSFQDETNTKNIRNSLLSQSCPAAPAA